MSEQGFTEKDAKNRHAIRVYVYHNGNEYTFINPEVAFLDKSGKQYIVKEQGVLYRFFGTFVVKEMRIN